MYKVFLFFVLVCHNNSRPNNGEMVLTMDGGGIEIPCNTQNILHGCNSFFLLTNFSLFAF